MLEKIRENGASHIVVCMSGNVTQRGDFAVFDKHTRAKAALLNGADLIIELPVPYACSGAERFAFGGVCLLNSLGCTERLYFGSECGDIQKLTNACNAVLSDEVGQSIGQYLNLGMTFAAARENAVAECFGGLSDILHEPNNILAIEYIKALRTLNSAIQPCTIKRTGAAHDSHENENGIASASLIRERIYDGVSYRDFIPENTVDVLDSCRNPPPHLPRLKFLEKAVLYRLRMMSKDDFAQLPDISEGLENRLYHAVRNGTSIDEILTEAKCKRYPLSRIRRSMINAFLGITKESHQILPQYIRVLGFNQNGRDILRIMRKSGTLPVIMKSADIRKCSTEARQMFALESRCDDIFSLSGEKNIICGQNLTENMIIL